MEALRRPALPEDAVRYRLFAAAAAGPGGEALLRRCAELALVRFAPLLAAYVWQRQPFRLRYVPGRGEIPAHLGGTTEFGDNVEDEWFIVYLLREITREFPGLAAREKWKDQPSTWSCCTWQKITSSNLLQSQKAVMK
ncbi:protein ecdysoneless homolog [Zonotrichia leucophrys gambelii]|uniref:protein ecdysoneless homolog n=1 Tax=Zonotrichia leucophrys gambelii TaxID=257770 RepID=UPI0031401B20